MDEEKLDLSADGEEYDEKSSWDDIDLGDLSDEDDEAESEPDEQEEADPQKPDVKTDDDEKSPAPAPQADPAKTPTKEAEPPKPETFELKHLGETKAVSRDEIIALAQKGMDYDRIKSRNDESDKHSAWLRGIAKDEGVTVDALIEAFEKNRDETKIQALYEKNADKGWTPEFARERYLFDKEKRADAAKKETEDNAKKESDAAAQKETDRIARETAEFLKVYPNVAVDKEHIPQEVKDGIAKGMSLLNAYKSWELAKKEADLSAREKNLENKTKTTGSKQTAGNQPKVEKGFEGWVQDW